MPTATMEKPAAGEKGAPPPRPRSFIVGSRQNDKPQFSQQVVLSTVAQQLNSFMVKPTAFLRGVYLIFENVAVNTTVTTVAYQEDGPFTALSSVRFLDTNSREMLGTMTGYDVYLLNKYGGYALQDDAKASQEYTATSGTATTAGSFSFIILLPCEFVKRNALGSQLNKSGAAQFEVELFVAGTGAIFSTAPATSSTLTVRAELASWLDPTDNDSQGKPVEQAPPFLNTTQYWHKQHYVITAGQQDTELTGIDGLVRSMIFIAKRVGGTRANGEADWPDPFSLKYEESFLMQSRIRRFWRWQIARNYGYDAAAEASKGRDNGVYPVWEFMDDFDVKPGNELGRKYLPMTSASTIEISGSWGNAVDLYVLVNKIVPIPQGQVNLAVL